MTTLRILSLRAGCGALLAAALFGCERQNPVELADQRYASSASTEAAVRDVVPGFWNVDPHVLELWMVCSRNPGLCNPFRANPFDSWLVVDILDVGRYFPGRLNPDLVRIGSSWELGTPVQSFEILDINMDGNRDIRLHWDLQEALRDGNVSPVSKRIDIWGFNPIDGRRFFGSAEVEWELQPM